MTFNKFSPQKLCRLWDNVEKCGEARGVTNDVTIWRKCAARWISKATCAHAYAHAHALPKHTRVRAHTDKYVILIAFPLQQWFVHAPQCYVIRTLPVLLLSSFWTNRLATWSCPFQASLVRHINETSLERNAFQVGNQRTKILGNAFTYSDKASSRFHLTWRHITEIPRSSSLTTLVAQVSAFLRKVLPLCHNAHSGEARPWTSTFHPHHVPLLPTSVPTPVVGSVMSRQVTSAEIGMWTDGRTAAFLSSSSTPPPSIDSTTLGGSVQQFYSTLLYPPHSLSNQ